MMPVTLTRFSDIGTAVLEKFRGLQRYRVSFEGYVVIGLMGLVGFAAWHSGTNLLYLIFAMLISVFLVHGFVVWLMLRNLQVSRRVPPHIHAEADTTLSLEVSNRRYILGAYGIRLADHLARGQTIGAAFALRVPPRRTSQVSFTTKFPHRGRFSLRRIDLTTRFPFGLVERGFSAIHPQEILVYPALYQVDKLAQALTAELGEYDSQKKGEGTDFYGLREYTSGDPARLIHWRSSARTRKLVVLEHEKDERRRIALSLTNLAPVGESLDDQTLEAFERSISMAASLARYFIEAGYDVQLVTASGATKSGTGEGQLYKIYKILSTLELVQKVRVAPPQLAGTSVVNITFSNVNSLNPGITADARDWQILNGAFVRRSKE